MNIEKQNYLSVTYQASKGLVFKWNFKDLFQYTTFFHHFFVIRSTDHKYLTHFLTNYYKKMKFGDLFTAIYYDSQKSKIKKLKWIEKSQLSALDFSKIITKFSSEPLPNQIMEQLTQLAIEQTSNNAQHFIVNFVLEDDFKQSREYIERLIIDGRNKGGFSYICSFFGKFDVNSISYTTGVNIFSSSFEDIQEIFQFYYIHVNNAAIKTAKLNLQCVNGQLLSNNPDIWKNVEFNKLQKVFYGPSASYKTDEIYFYLSDVMGINQIELVINLEVTLFSCQKLGTNKRIKLSFPLERHFDKSLSVAICQSHFNMKGIWISYNPYSTFSIVRMIKNTDGSSSPNR